MRAVLRLAVQNHGWAATQAGLKITVSLGLSERQQVETPAQWFARTDAAIYQAKHQGRNQVVQAAESPVASPITTDGAVDLA